MYEAGTKKWQECLDSSEEPTGKNIIRWLLLCDKADYEYDYEHYIAKKK